jgi:hypothetical protein
VRFACHAATDKARQQRRAERTTFHQFNGIEKALSARTISWARTLIRSIVQNYIKQSAVANRSIQVELRKFTGSAHQLTFN